MGAMERTSEVRYDWVMDFLQSSGAVGVVALVSVVVEGGYGG